MEVYVFVAFSEGLLIIFTSFAITSLLTPRDRIRHPRLTAFCFHTAVFLAILTSTGFSISFIPIAVMAALLLTCMVLFHNKVSHKLSAFFIIYFMILICEGSTGAIMRLINLLFPKAELVTYYMLLEGNSRSYIVYVIIDMALYYVVCKLIIPTIQYCLALADVKITLQIAFPIGGALLISNVFASYSFNLQQYLLLTAICILIYICSFVLFIRGFHSLQKLNAQQLQLELEERQLKSQHTHSKILEKQYEDFRKWNHDISNHLLSISYLIEKGDFINAYNYIGNILDSTEENQQ